MTRTTAKLSVMVTPDVKRRLEAEARVRKISVGELVRRRLEGERDGDERLFVSALEAVGRRAIAVMEDLDTTHAAAARERAAWLVREKRLRELTRAGLSQSDIEALRTALKA